MFELLSTVKKHIYTGLILSILLVLTILLVGCGGKLVSDSIVREVVSPDGSKKVVEYHIDGGSLSANYLFASIVSSKRNKKVRPFHYFVRTRGIVSLNYVRKNNKILEVQYDDGAVGGSGGFNFQSKETDYKGLNIIYNSKAAGIELSD